MSAANRHRILRQILELDLTSAAQAVQIQETAAQTLRERAPRELESLFDRVVGPDRILRLERLELDLGDLAGSDWPEQLLRRLLDQLEASLARAVHPSRAEPERASPLQDSVDDRFQQLLFFLAHGRLPWWGGKPADGWTQALPNGFSSRQRQALGMLLRDNVRARRRLIYSIDDAVLSRILESLAGLQETALVMARLAPAGLPSIPLRRWREAFWLLLLDIVAAEPPLYGPPPLRTSEPVDGVQLMQRLLQRRLAILEAAGRADRPQAGAHSRPENNAIPPLPAPWQDWLKAVDPEKIRSEPPQTATQPKVRTDQPPWRKPAAQRPGEKPQDSQTSAGSPVPAAERGLSEQRTGSADSASRGAARANDLSIGPADDETVYLEGAGAVILHPFLEELFASRRLWDGRNFRDAEARGRAVRLLGYLVFGSDEVAEYELLLAKLLCGLPWQEPLPLEPPDEEAHAACEELLQAVLRHWQALKSASSVWLRKHFFLREGKLEAVDTGWKLTVERRAQDVLLGKLPWGIGLIRLPWMQGFLYVKWTD